MNYFNTLIDKHRIKYVNNVSSLIYESIPNFKPAWLEIGRYMKSDNSRWLDNLSPEIECIGTGHYTLLKSLNFITITKNISDSYLNDSEQRFKNIFFHFGVITDCSNQIARCIVLTKAKLGLIEYNHEQIDLNDLVTNIKSWYKENYETRYKEMLKYGIPVNIEIQPYRDDYFKTLDKNKDYTKDYFVFRDAIQSYRNAYIHNPMIDVFKYGEEEYVIDIKPSKKVFIKLNEYRYLSQLDKLGKKHFIHPQKLIDRNYGLLLKGLDSLWTLFSNEIKCINEHEDFEKVLFRDEE